MLKLSLKEQMYLTFGAVFTMIVIYTKLAWYNYTHPRKLPKRDKRKKHAWLKMLLEDKRNKENKNG